jgi:hypothetical protein
MFEVLGGFLNMLDVWDEAIYFILKLEEPLVHSVIADLNVFC